MAKPKAKAPSLFDVLAVEEAKAEGQPCPHPREEPTVTVWPEYRGKYGPGDPRMTWTCRDCGQIRGRC